MRNCRIILCVLMAVCLLAGLLPAGALAETVSTPYHSYVSLGDSIPAGRGEFPQQTMRGFTRIEGIYPTLVADALGADFTPLAYCGFRTNEIRWMLDDNYEGDEDLFRGSQVPLVEPLRSQMRPVFKEAIKNADIITLNIGSNDLFSYPLRMAVSGLNLSALTPSDEFDDNVITRNLDGDAESLDEIISIADAAGMLDTLINNLITGIQDAYTMFLENYSYIVNYIYENNPDVTLVAVGLLNNAYNVKLTDQSAIELGRVFDGVFRSINAYIQYGVPHQGKYIYADVMGTECPQFEPLPSKILSVIPGIEHSELPFGDVPAREWYYDGVKYAYNNQLMVGSSKSLFEPQSQATRAQIATVLYSLAGRPSGSGSEPFADVAEGDWYYPAVRWAYNEGVVGGVSSDQFDPNTPVTRAQMVLMLYRAAGSPAVSGSLSFRDKGAIAPEYADAVLWAQENQVAGGFEDGSFRPDDPVTRAQMAVLLAAYCQ